MPTCRDMSELVTDYLERATPLRLRLEMWLHLLRCDACRRYFDQMRGTVLLLSRGTPSPPSGETEQRVVAAAQETRARDE